ncbi:hypothetical protein XI05_26910 [Bradyrhizobium sp. CCBAU 11357]|nr:hypothetical protein [Bradyrhizobium sp. CCBAU 11357]
MIQIISVNTEALGEALFALICSLSVNRWPLAARREKGGVRIAEAAFEPGNIRVFASSRFTAR